MLHKEKSFPTETNMEVRCFEPEIISVYQQNLRQPIRARKLQTLC